MGLRSPAMPVLQLAQNANKPALTVNHRVTHASRPVFWPISSTH
jgi:hypothetical protein